MAWASWAEILDFAPEGPWKGAGAHCHEPVLTSGGQLALDMLASEQVDGGLLITDETALADIQKTFKELSENAAGHQKVLVKPIGRSCKRVGH